MTKAGLAIFILEIIGIWRLFKKYFGDQAGPATIEEFLARATLEDVIRLTIHQRGAFFGLCLATMGRLFQ
jgi:hypothetical protein